MSHVSEFDFQGKHIVQVTFPAGTTIDGLMAIFAEVKPVYAAQPKGSILSLTVFDGFEVDEAMINLFEQVATANLSLVRATAFVGVKGPQIALFKAMIGVTGRKAKLFDNAHEAKSWLVETSTDADILNSL